MEFLRDDAVICEDHSAGSFREAERAREKRVCVGDGFCALEWREVHRLEIRETPVLICAQGHRKFCELIPRRLLAFAENAQGGWRNPGRW